MVGEESRIYIINIIALSFNEIGLQYSCTE